MLDCFRSLLLSALSICAAAQSTTLDHGRLDPSWFGAQIAFQPAKKVAFLWLSPGFAIQGRVIRVVEWEPPVWLGKKRGDKDRRFLQQMEGSIPGLLEAGLRKGLGGRTRVSRQEGDLLLSGRAVDATGPEENGTFADATSLTFDLKLSDAASGELLGAFHHTISSLSDGNWSSLFAGWCEDLGRTLAEKPKPAAAPTAPAASKVPTPVAKPTFDLKATLQRLEALRQDGILAEAEFNALRRKAEEKAGAGGN